MSTTPQTNESNDSAAIVPLSGRLGMEGTGQLKQTLTDALTQNPHGIILDMAEVTFVSSAGLRVLVQARHDAEETGKAIALIRVQPAVYKILKLTAFEKLFGVFENEKQALKAITK